MPACVLILEPFVPLELWRAGEPEGCHQFVDRLISKVPKIFQTLFFYSAVDSLISRGLTIRSTSES